MIYPPPVRSPVLNEDAIANVGARHLQIIGKDDNIINAVPLQMDAIAPPRAGARLEKYFDDNCYFMDAVPLQMDAIATRTAEHDANMNQLSVLDKIE